MGLVMVRALACDSRGREFNSRLFRWQVTTLGKLFTHVPLSPSSIYSVPVAGQWCPATGKVTVGQCDAGSPHRTGHASQI